MRIAWLVTAVIGISQPASAKVCASPSGSSSALESIDAEVRLAFLKRQLHSQATKGVLWMGIWGSAYGAIATTTLAVTPLLPEENKKAMYVGSAASLIGTLRVLLLPPKVIAAVEQLDVDTSSGDDACDQLVLAEKSLRRLADDQKKGRKWHVHVLNVVFNIGLGLLVGAAFDQWILAAVRTVTGIAIGETLIFTQPSALPGVEDRYLAGNLHEESGFWKAQWRPTLMRGQVGVAFSF